MIYVYLHGRRLAEPDESTSGTAWFQHPPRRRAIMSCFESFMLLHTSEIPKTPMFNPIQWLRKPIGGVQFSINPSQLDMPILQGFAHEEVPVINPFHR